MPSGSVAAGVEGSTSQQVRIQASTNLVGASWTDLVNLPPLGGMTEYIDDGATNYPARFYQAISL
jgi:hypothetical protein